MNKYKVGDVLVISSSNSEFIEIVQVTAVDLNNLMSVYKLVLLDATYTDYAGPIGDRCIHRTDYNTEIDLFPKVTTTWYPEISRQGIESEAALRYLFEQNNLKKRCACPTFELVNFGCKCGGI